MAANAAAGGAAGGVLPSSSLPVGLTTAPSAAGAASTVAAGAGGLTPTATVAREMLQRFGAGASAGADAMAANRGTQFSADTQRAMLAQQAERDFYNQSIAREQAGRDKDRNAWEMMKPHPRRECAERPEQDSPIEIQQVAGRSRRLCA